MTITEDAPPTVTSFADAAVVPDDELLPVGQLVRVPPAWLIAAEDNLRAKLGADSDEWKALVESIRAEGVLVPLAVTPDRRIVAGHRRQAAALHVGLETVPVVVQTYTETERQILMLVENLHRVNLDPMEEAAGYFRLCNLGLTVKDLAARLGRSAGHVAARLAILELPGPVQEKVAAGTVTVEAAAALYRMKRAGFADKEVVAASKSHNPGSEATRQLEAKKRSDGVDKRVAQLVRAGVVAKANRQPAGWKSLSQSTIKTADHKTEPCHGVVVEWPTFSEKLREVGYCSDPKRHATRGASKLKDKFFAGADPATGREPKASDGPPLWERQADARRRNLEIAKEAAVAAVKALTGATALDLLAEMQLHDIPDRRNAVEVCDLLSIDYALAEDPERTEVTDDDLEEAAAVAFRKWLGEAPKTKRAERVLLAIAAEQFALFEPGEPIRSKLIAMAGMELVEIPQA
jgi:ParB family chromosome partitioning protein